MDIKLRSPENDQASVILPEAASDLQKSYSGTICSDKGNEYKITANLVDMLHNGHSYNLAQRSNHLGLTASVYEDVWRKRSLSFLTGESFPVKKEQELLLKWLRPQSGQTYLDVGCSTALYARLVKQQVPDSAVAAIDISKPMLTEAKKKAAAEKANLFLIRADAREMPFFGGTFDGLMMGGTLNELTDELKVLYECRRVIKKDGVMFMMHLLQSPSWKIRILQKPAGLGGVQFWTVKESNDLFTRAGFKVEEQITKGIVCFSRLRAI